MSEENWLLTNPSPATLSEELPPLPEPGLTLRMPPGHADVYGYTKAQTLAYARTAVEAAIIKEGEVFAFLLGEGPLDGVWFGDDHPTEPGKFWWRKHLRAAAIRARK